MSLCLDDVRVSFAGRSLFSPVTLEIPPGRIATLMAPSGTGKSSLLAAIAGILPPGITQSGHILLNGQDVGGLATSRRGIGLLFQDDLLFPHMSVAENLAFALPPAVAGRKERLSRAIAALRLVRLESFGARMPESLSGGQRSRVALLRALLAEPKALLLDEPYSSLDETLRAEMRDLVAGLVASRNIPALLVTHDRADIAYESLLLKLQPEPSHAG